MTSSLNTLIMGTAEVLTLVSLAGILFTVVFRAFIGR